MIKMDVILTKTLPNFIVVSHIDIEHNFPFDSSETSALEGLVILRLDVVDRSYVYLKGIHRF